MRETTLSNRPNVINFMRAYAACMSQRGEASKASVEYLKALEGLLTHEEREYIVTLIYGSKSYESES